MYRYYSIIQYQLSVWVYGIGNRDFDKNNQYVMLKLAIRLHQWYRFRGKYAYLLHICVWILHFYSNNCCLTFHPAAFHASISKTNVTEEMGQDDHLTVILLLHAIIISLPPPHCYCSISSFRSSDYESNAIGKPVF